MHLTLDQGPEMSRQENQAAEPPHRPRGRPRQTAPGQYSPGLPRDHPMQSLPPTARSILEAARRVLAQWGLEGLTIEAVANEVAIGEKRNCGLFSALRDDRELRPSSLEIEDGIGHVSLREECFFRLQLDDSAAKASVREKDSRVECTLRVPVFQNIAPF